MAGLILVEEGDGIPIVLQIADGNTGLFPQAKIRSDAGDDLGTVSLSHIANGLYQTIFTMTDDPYISATYIVYTDAGHTVESDIYCRDVDTFLLIMPSEYKADVSALETKIDSVISTLASMDTDLDFVKSIEGGKWQLTGTQMIFYKSDNITEVARFDITKDGEGNPTMRERV